MATSTAPTGTTQHALKREIGLIGLTWTSVGSIIGSGWLFGALFAAQAAGTAALVSWGIGAVAITILAFVHAELGAAYPVAGLWAFEAARIAAHIARPGLDSDHKTLPHEIGFIDDAVHLNKGCYRGQETVARIHNLGHPPRRLVVTAAYRRIGYRSSWTGWK